MRTGAEDVVGGVSGDAWLVGLGFAAEFAPQAEPCLVLPPSGGDVAGEKPEHCPHDDAEGENIERDGNDGAYGLYVAQKIQNGADEKQDQLGHEQGVVEAIGAVSTVKKSSQPLAKIVSHDLYPFHEGSA